MEDERQDLEVVDRVPLNKWRDDLAKISGEWNGHEVNDRERRAELAEEGIRLIEQLNKVLNDLNYA